MENYETLITRDSKVSPNIMSINEYARVISTRSKEIENGSVVFIENPENYSSSKEIAEAEIENKTCPYKIIRKVGLGSRQGIEEHDVNEMIKPRL